MTVMYLSDLESELREHLGEDTADLSTAMADMLLNRSYSEILNRYGEHFRQKEVSFTWPTIAGEKLYQVPADFEALRQLSIEDLNDQVHSPLVRMTPFEYERVFQNRSDAQDKPLNYVREDGCIRLFPTPDNVYTITMKYWKLLDALGGVVTQSALPAEWDEIILYGAVYRGFIRRGDYIRGQAARAHQETLMNTTKFQHQKEAGDTHLGGLDVAWGAQSVRENLPVNFNAAETIQRARP